MKKYTLIIAAACLGVAACVFAASPTYKALSGAGNNTAGAYVTFPATPGNQWRIVQISWNSDIATANLSFQGGAGAYSVAVTNAATTTVTNVCNDTTGMVTNSTLALDRAGTYYYATLTSTNNGTNYVLASGGWGVSTKVGDNIYQLDTAITIPVGNTTNSLAGEAIYVAGLPDRPVRVTLTPAAATNKLNSVVGRAE